VYIDETEEVWRESLNEAIIPVLWDTDGSRMTFVGYDDEGAPLFRMEFRKQSGSAGSDCEVQS
jgi:hypothetical protein